MKALDILRDNYISIVSDTDTEMALYYQDHIQVAIKELEEIENIKNTVIEEIEYAIAKPEYANVYLNNALRFLRNK